jgi:hypothetical protein
MSPSWWRKWYNNRKTTVKKKVPQDRRYRPFLEVLEDRIVPSTVFWDNPNGGNWDTATNWSSGSVPGSGDIAVINTAAAATITIHAGDSESVLSLTTASNDALSITGGSLTLAANSTLNGPLEMTGGSLTGTGSGITVTGTGPTSISAASLNAQSGATLGLPELTTYSGNGSGTFAVDGAGSVLDLSALATISEEDGSVSLSATNGGVLNLSGLTDTSLSGGSITDTGGSSLLLDSNLTTLCGIDVTLDGTDTQVANPWTSLTAGSLTITGGSYSLPKLTDVDGSSLGVSSGGSLTLPGMTSYTGNSNGTFSADGPGSLLDLSALTTIHEQSNEPIEGSTPDYSDVNLSATNRGELNLSGLMNTSLGGDSITDTGGSTILLDSSLTTLSGVNVTLDGTDSQVSNPWTSLTDGSLTILWAFPAAEA